MRPNSSQKDMNTGFRPCSRVPFLSGKGSKTIDAPSGHISMGRTRTVGARANSLCSNRARVTIRASDPGASRQASDKGGGTCHPNCNLKQWPMWEWGQGKQLGDHRIMLQVKLGGDAN